MGFKIGKSGHKVQIVVARHASTLEQSMISMNTDVVVALCAIKIALVVYWPSFNVFLFDKPSDKPIMERLACRHRPDICMKPQPGDDAQTLKIKRQFVEIWDRVIVQGILDKLIKELWTGVDREVLKLIAKIDELNLEQVEALEVELEKVESLGLMELGQFPKWFADILKTYAELSCTDPVGGNSFTNVDGNGN